MLGMDSQMVHFFTLFFVFRSEFFDLLEPILGFITFTLVTFFELTHLNLKQVLFMFYSKFLSFEELVGVLGIGKLFLSLVELMLKDHCSVSVIRQ